MNDNRLHNTDNSLYFTMDSLSGDTVKYNFKKEFEKYLLKIAQNEKVIKWISDKTQL